MHALIIIIVMVVIGAIIGGVTNMIAVRMLFHPFKPYYIFNKRIPFTPGLIPKRREEIATKIGQVIEDHLLTESLIHSKLNAPETRAKIHQLIVSQIEKLKHDDVTLQSIADALDIDLADVANQQITTWIERKLNDFYDNHQQESLETILPEALEQYISHYVNQATPLLFERARVYLESEKGERDIYHMLESFFQEKGKIIGMLQMFMTKESIADRIRQELIRLTHHPRAQEIAEQIIQNEYATLKSKSLGEIISTEQFSTIRSSVTPLIMNYLNLDRYTHQPLNELMPQFITFLEDKVSVHVTDLLINNISKQLSSIMKEIDLRGMIEAQINTFDLDYIERLIIEIANKELKLIMLLGFILGGIIGMLQGIIAIFV